MSPSQRATDGAERPSPPARPVPAARRARRRSYSAPRATSIRASSPRSVDAGAVGRRPAEHQPPPPQPLLLRDPRRVTGHHSGRPEHRPDRGQAGQRPRLVDVVARSARARATAPGGEQRRAGGARPARRRRTSGAAGRRRRRTTSAVSDRDPGVDGASSWASWTQHRAAAGEEPLDERGAVGGRRPRRRAPGRAALDRRRRPPPGVVEQAGRPALDQPVDAAPRRRGRRARRASSRRRAGWSTTASARLQRRSAARPSPARASSSRPAARPVEPGDDAHDELVEHGPQAGGVGAAARRRSAARRRAGRGRPSARRRRARGRRSSPSDPHGTARRRRAGRRAGPGSTAAGGVGEPCRAGGRPLDEPRRRRGLDASCRGRRARRAAPTARAPTPRATSRGTCRVEPRPSSSVPHGDPERDAGGGAGASAAARSASAGRARRRRPSASGFRRAARWAAARSRASGTCGASGGTSPMASPTTSSSTTSGSPPSTALGGVEHLGQPGARPAAQGGQRVGEARRGDQVVGRRRHAPAAQGVGGVDEEPRHALRAGVAEHVGVPARAGDAGAVAGRPGASRRCVHGTHVTATFTFGRPAQRRRVGGGGRSTAGSSAGTCHAPHTTATRRRPPASARGSRRRMCASRRRVAAAGGRARRATAAIASADGVEHRLAVAAVLDEVLPPPLGVRLAGRRGERAERVDGRSRRPGSVVGRRRRRRERRSASGRSIASTATSRARAPSATACHSGLNSASGANTARSGSVDDVAEQRDRRHEPGVGRSSAARSSASAGDLDEHDVGLQLVERRARTERAEPGRGGGCRAGAAARRPARAAQPSSRQAS